MNESLRSWAWTTIDLCFWANDPFDIRPGTPTSAYCPRCGASLGFAPDGQPTVGPTYADQARKAAAIDKLEAWELGSWKSTEGWVTERPNTNGEPDDTPYESLLAWAEALPDISEKEEQ